jgi:hypothetical protein
LTSLSLYEDLLGPGESLQLPAGSRVLYVASGAVSGLHAGEAYGSADALELKAGDDGATLLRWELTDWGVEDARLTVPVEVDPWGDYVLRCERVEGDARDSARGIACLLRGELLVDRTSMGAFEAWALPAEAEVATRDAAVVRVTVVPADDPAAVEPLAEGPVRL